MKAPSFRGVGAVWLSVALCGALVAGCGGTAAPAAPRAAAGSGSSQHAASAAAGGGGASGSAATTVTFGKAVNSFGLDVVNIAQREGYFAQVGIRPKIEVVGGSTVADSALVGGSAQFTLVGTLPLLLGRAKHLPLVAVDSLDYGVPIQLIVYKKWIQAHHLSPGQPLQARLQGLKGSTFGQIGPTDVSFFDYMLRRAGVPSSTVKVVRLGSDTAARAALQHGEIDEFAISPPTSVQLQAQGFGQILLNYKSVSQFRDMAYDLIVTTSTYAKAHPAIMKKVATAVGKGDNFIIQHPRQTRKIFQQLWPQLPASVIGASLSLLTFSKDGVQTQQQWQNAVKTLKTFGVIKGPVVATQGTVWTNQYIDRAALGTAG